MSSILRKNTQAGEVLGKNGFFRYDLGAGVLQRSKRVWLMKDEDSPYDFWQDPLSTRYATEPMRRLFSERNRIRTWRKVWLALAEAQRELGVEAITEEALSEMRANIDNIDFEEALRKEREIRHDVMAHVHAFCKVCPKAAGIIHLGATSEFVCGNADLIIQREALKLIVSRLVTCMDQLASHAEKYADLICLGYTHFQVAQPTTVGKRLCLYLHDFLIDLERITWVLKRLRARGAKGTVGTQASFLALLKDPEKVEELDRRVAKKLGFQDTFPVTGQTYPRKVDVEIAEVLAGIGSSAHKFAVDLRLLSHLKEVEEPFEAQQTGSSAMPYKRNPMRSERLTSLARKLMAIPATLRQTHANQWLERTLDDSALRRLEIPQAFLLTDAILNLLQNITSRLTFRPDVIENRLKQYLPFLASEEILVACVKKGGSRQHCHERLKLHSKETWEKVLQGDSPEILYKKIGEDPNLPLTEEEVRALASDPRKFVGMAQRQTRSFVSSVREKLKEHRELIGKLKDEVTV